MEDEFTPFETGLARLEDKLDESYPRYVDALGLESQLRLKIRQMRLDGEEPSCRAEMNRIVRQLNQLALDMIGVSFNELCKQNATTSLRLPLGHSHIRTDEQTGIHYLIREQDRQSVLYLPAGGRTFSPFLIDQYPVTNSQYAEFLNTSEVQAQTSVSIQNGIQILVSQTEDRALVADARSYWAKWTGPRKPSPPWGLVFEAGVWRPLADSARLPITLVTSWGASWYAVWANGLSIADCQSGSEYLPNENQWLTAALWNYETKRMETYPWGSEWDAYHLNSIAYWAGREFMPGNEVMRWLSNTEPLRQPRPTPVDAFPNGASPSGLMDAFGNVWEWLADSAEDGSHLTRGGACTSPRDRINLADRKDARIYNPYIGFRCCRPTV